MACNLDCYQYHFFIIYYFHLLQEPSLFAVAKLLETGLVNLPRVEVLWKPVTAHVLEVSTFSLLGF